MKTAAVLGVASASLILTGASGVSAADSPTLSGNVVKVPVNIPITACGITASVLGEVTWGAISQPLCPTDNVQLELQAPTPAGGDLMP